MMTGAPIEMRDAADKAIPHRELLRVVSINHSKRQARLVSRLQHFDGERFVAVVYHVGLSNLPPDVALGQEFRRSKYALTPVKPYSQKKLRAYKRLLRLTSRPLGARPHTRRQAHSAIRRRLKEMVKAGIFEFSSKGDS